ncbi:carbohydrate ABC transporter membrane protein 2, CUT1 family [Proteiniborus ethanoligenes]|uniref:Carbohydrate ABC transporter membrane protein 2, CUT1 family n=1 Tax=Proteiniborus ethanoligenes TaxID=415015 RepID=A0A1H3P9A8_9FIRM|nr:carbohydrate ABC transporter permease [Proteiniborus ethanoligenes]TAH63984.1 MAG: carbohydrate ABC transporter permease [Gottschalkiaceae bacterium]SDY97668.1 carbohydrate ABC transporter membrane protein 2, CUT1 family [Proteiniborus ethanoligenes]
MRKNKKLAVTIFLITFALLILLPLIVTVTNSFMGNPEIMESHGVFTREATEREKEKFRSVKLIPDSIVFEQYYEVLVGKSKFLRMFWNSVFLVLPIVIFQTIISSSAAFVFAKMKFKGRDTLFFIYIIIMMMPFQVTLVPNYLVLDKLGILDNYMSIILPGIFGAFGVFLLRQFMISIPNEYIEAAMVDGCSLAQIFFKVILPQSKGGVASLAILSFIDNWNMVEQPLIFLKDTNKHPLSIYLSVINNSELGIAFAASVIYMIPALLVFLYGQNYLIEGISNSTIKK